MFEGIRGNSYTGDIALDDISFTVGAANCIQRPYDSLPPGVTTSAPTLSTSSSVAPTTIGKFVFISIRIEQKKQKTKKIIVTTSLLEVLEKVRFYRALSGYV